MADKTAAAVVDPEEDFDAPVTRAAKLGTAEPTNTGPKKSAPKLADSFQAALKALGLKTTDVLSFNEGTRVFVTSGGGKYQISKKGRGLRHLAGPPPPADAKLDVVDARSRSPFVGTAAALNASVHEDHSTQTQLIARKAELEAELSDVNAELGETSEEE